MRTVIIGGCGHYGFATEEVKKDPSLTVCAMAQGPHKEDMSGVIRACEGAGQQPKVYENYLDMLDTEKPELAVVDPFFCDNARVSIECLKRGIHVFSEKPLATKIGELDELESVYRASGCALQGMFNLRCCGWFNTVKKAVDEGKIGVVRTVQGRKSYKLGKRSETYLKMETFGGILPWVGIHAIDWVLTIGGKCLSAYGLQDAGYNNGNGECETASAAIFRLENGVIGSVTADFYRPDGAPRHDDDRLLVTGTGGFIEALNGKVYIEDSGPRRELELVEGKNCLRVMLDAIGTDEADRLARAAFDSTRAALRARDGVN